MSSDLAPTRHPNYRHQQLIFGMGIFGGLCGLGYQLYDSTQHQDPPDWWRLGALVGISVMSAFGMYYAVEYQHPIATIPENYVVLTDGEPPEAIANKVRKIYEDCGLHAHDKLNELTCLGQLEEIHTRCKDLFGPAHPNRSHSPMHNVVSCHDP